MNKRKISNWFWAIIFLMPFLFVLFFVLLNYRTNSGNITIDNLFNSVINFISSSDVINIVPNLFNNFILSLVNAIYSTSLSNLNDLVSSMPFVFLVFWLGSYQVIVLLIKLIFDLFRWFISFADRLINKYID